MRVAGNGLGGDALGSLKYAVDHLGDSLKLVDALLRAQTPAGPVWRRYTGDGYGEHADGRAFDGTGQGHGWPLLTGERVSSRMLGLALFVLLTLAVIALLAQRM